MLILSLLCVPHLSSHTHVQQEKQGSNPTCYQPTESRSLLYHISITAVACLIRNVSSPTLVFHPKEDLAPQFHHSTIPSHIQRHNTVLYFGGLQKAQCWKLD